MGIQTESNHKASAPHREERPLGGVALPGGRCSFLVWAPKAERVEVNITAPGERIVPLEPGPDGYHSGVIEGVGAGARYFYRLDGRNDFPDPASRFQPEGVHKASEVAGADFPWTDADWRGIPLRDYIIYELHAGTFSEEGTFEGVIPRLKELKELGITAIELMPVAQFPGGRNWGYDGVALFAAQNSYGGPEGMKRLVNACHAEGIAVILDVVYNHLGPEGNYLSQFGAYFTDSYNTPWGQALNFDGPGSREVRRFFIENALYWQRELHIDALRLDAVHSIRDNSAYPFLQQLAARTHREAERLNRPFYLIAETDLNAPRFVLPEVLGGYGLDAQWSDDFHHCLHVLLTGERSGYYKDFHGVRQFGKVFQEGYAYTGEYSEHRRALHGANPVLIELQQMAVCGQNHDQVGNRAQGDRLAKLVDFERLKVAAGAVIFSPFLPMLFMGEEHGEPNPFQYMTSHGDPALIEAVRKGRREEFASFAWSGEVPDPQDEETFKRSRVRHGLKREGRHKLLFEFYSELIRTRKSLRIFAEVRRPGVRVEVFEPEQVLAVHYSAADKGEALLLLAFGKEAARARIAPAPGEWRRVIDSSAKEWEGPGSKLPERFESAGTVEVELPGAAAALFQKI